MNRIIDEELAALKSEIAAEQKLISKSSRQILETESLETINKLSLSNEKFFKLRFGFIKPSEQRAHILYLKNQFDLTDDEVTNLEYSKSIKLDYKMPSLILTDKISYKFAIFAIPFFAFLSIICTAITMYSIIQSKEFFFLAISSVLSAVTAWHFYKSAVKPVHILRKRAIKPGQEFILQRENFIPSDTMQSHISIENKFAQGNVTRLVEKTNVSSRDNPTKITKSLQ